MGRTLRRPRVGWDVDGPLYDFEESLRVWLVNHCGWSPSWCPPARDWDFYTYWGCPLPDGTRTGMTRAEFIDACNAGVDAGVIFTHGHARPGAAQTMERLAAAGLDQVVITNRFFGDPFTGSHYATRAWFEREGLPRLHTVFSADKTVVRTDYMIEDNLDNYDALEASGCTPFLIETLWNTTPELADDGRRRVKTLAQFGDAVLADLATRKDLAS